MQNRFLVLLFIFGISVAAPVASAHASWIEFFFPMLKEEDPYDPSKTLVAPFANDGDPAGVETTGAGVQSPGNQTVPLHLSHRSDSEISEWVTTAISEAMSYTSEDYSAEIEGHKKLFDPNGWKQFEAFLSETNMMKVIESDRYQLRSYVRGTPILLNEGAVSKRYRWLYEVTTNISYLERNVRDYKNVEPENRTVKARVQIGRSPSAENEIGLLVERWDGKIVKDEE